MGNALQSRYPFQDHVYPLRKKNYELLQALIVQFGLSANHYAKLEPACPGPNVEIECRKADWVQHLINVYSNSTGGQNATLTTGADDYEIDWTYDLAGTIGNDINLIIANPATASHALTIEKVGNNVTVTLATDAGTKATQALTFTNQPADGETFTVGATAYTFRAAADADYEITIGANLAATIVNAAAVVNGTDANTTPAHANVVATATSGTVLTVTAKVAGTAANAYATTETITNASFGAATMAGGVNPAITSTANEVVTAANASSIVSAVNAAGSDGTDTMVAAASADFTGGLDAQTIIDLDLSELER
jgi:hypothetical protein